MWAWMEKSIKKCMDALMCLNDVVHTCIKHWQVPVLSTAHRGVVQFCIALSLGTRAWIFSRACSCRKVTFMGAWGARSQQRNPFPATACRGGGSVGVLLLCLLLLSH